MGTARESSEQERPTVALGVLQPFFRLLTASPLDQVGKLFSHPEFSAHMHAQAPTSHIPVHVARACLKSAVKRAADPDVGLKAGRLFDMEHGATLTYATSSAPTVGAAMAIAARAMGLLTNILSYRIVRAGVRVEVHLDSECKLTREESDFVASALRSHHRRTHSSELRGMSWHFAHPRPANVAEYERTFGPAPCLFSAAYLGFSFDAAEMDIPLRTADERFHRRAAQHLDMNLVNMIPGQSVARFTRELILRELGRPELDAKYVARRLHVSMRTFGRRLHEEGTTFRQLLRQARKQQAQQFLTGSDHSIGTISSLLGFAEVPSFHRAFRRWTAMTPEQYRRLARRSA
jgi:AraC-like DNA-binding protein